MRLSDHQAAFTHDLATLIRSFSVVTEHKYRIRILEVARTLERQQALIYARKSWIKNAATAPHVEKRAADIALDRRTEHGWEYLTATEDYREVGEMWEELSPYNIWGGRFRDGNHFERRKEPREGTNGVFA
jgi:hypothetical protein